MYPNNFYSTSMYPNAHDCECRKKHHKSKHHKHRKHDDCNTCSTTCPPPCPPTNYTSNLAFLIIIIGIIYWLRRPCCTSNPPAV
jgi:hypothetical protein